ncbi:MAG: HD domain-containing protein [Eubacteriales bacterium]|nr:HD domain-containing protein [Eubacteriales bacterium]
MYEHKAIEKHSMLASIIDTTLYKHVEKNAKAGTHSNRVSQLCKYLGQAMGLSDIELYKLEISGLFHDIGKIAIQDYILDKPGKLSEQEWKEIMRHPEIGYWILCTSLEMSDIAKYVLYHHERYDGEGYPKGLREREIPLFSRIISVVDSYDAMTNHRAYKETLDQEMAICELVNNKGKQFDPEIVEVFIEKVLNRKL